MDPSNRGVATSRRHFIISSFRSPARCQSVESSGVSVFRQKATRVRREKAMPFGNAATVVGKGLLCGSLRLGAGWWPLIGPGGFRAANRRIVDRYLPPIRIVQVPTPTEGGVHGQRLVTTRSDCDETHTFRTLLPVCIACFHVGSGYTEGYWLHCCIVPSGRHEMAGCTSTLWFSLLDGTAPRHVSYI